jgi:hypothetical protein
MTLRCQARSIRAWVDGREMPVRDGRITLGESARRVSKVALRLEHAPGYYGGAAMLEPVSFECGQGLISLGDWCDYALESYSGGATYSKDFELTEKHLAHKIIIDLGRVQTTAQLKVNGVEVGVRVARPHRYDITDYVKPGRNRLNVTVYNTLANHFSIGFSSSHVFEGQTVSGLLGPVSIEFLKQVRLTARRRSTVVNQAPSETPHVLD